MDPEGYERISEMDMMDKKCGCMRIHMDKPYGYER